MQLLDLSVFWPSFACDVCTLQTLQALMECLHTLSVTHKQAHAYGYAYSVGDYEYGNALSPTVTHKLALFMCDHIHLLSSHK